MNRGLLMRAFRETRGATLGFALALLAVEAVLSLALPALEKNFLGTLLELPFVQRIVQTLAGVETGGATGPGLLASVAFVHPVVLALIWGHAVVVCTRVPAGEVDHGTADLWMALPVSRWQVYGHEALAWLVSGAGVLAGMALGSAAGGLLGGAHPSPRPLLVITLNMLALYVAVGGFAWLVSAVCERRGRAVAVVFGVLVAALLVNYLGQSWNVTAGIVFLMPLHYYRPHPILAGAWPLRDMLVLASAGLVLWCAGGLLFARRDLPTT